MAAPASPRPFRSRRRSRCGVAVADRAGRRAIALGIDVARAGGALAFPARPAPARRAARRPPKPGAEKQMLVRADEVDYDYTNDRVSAVGNVQIYYRARRSKPTGSSTIRRPSACTPKAMSG